MTKKIILLLTISMLVMTSCATGDSTPEPAGTTDSSTTMELAEEPTLFTLEDLAQYDGKDGNPAYVAVDGIVYDVSASSLWKDGGHNGFQAGRDLTEPIKTKSPHGVVKLDNLPIVGELEE